MRRREFVAGLGSAATWPVVAGAQQSATPVIGFLHAGSPIPFAHASAAFRQGLKEAGYVEGQKIAIEYRWANNELDKLPHLAADLVNRQVTVLVSGGGAASALAAKAATSTTPIVVVFGADPVQLGLVASLNRPGGNITGVTFLGTELMSKRLELLHRMVPQATTIAYLAGDQRVVVGREMLRDIMTAATVLGLQVVSIEARTDTDFEPAFTTFIERRARALVVGSEPLFDSLRGELVALAASHKLPAIYQAREYPLDGGLMSYGTSYANAFRLGGRYVAQVLKGTRPADLPFEQSSRFELVINLKTAKALDLEVAPILLIQADELIE
jgi:putative tryptophan/tyrosine transport system substrate-binding protein